MSDPKKPGNGGGGESAQTSSQAAGAPGGAVVPARKKGEVVIQKVERDLAQVTRRYLFLVLSTSSEPRPTAEVVESIRAAAPGATAQRRLAGGSAAPGSGNGGGPEPVLDLREGLLVQDAAAEQRVQLEFYAFADCPWFDRDAPAGSWSGVYEVVGDVALKDKEKDPRFGFLSAVARAVAKISGGATFDLQEWKLAPTE